MTFTGTVADINTALKWVSFQPDIPAPSPYFQWAVEDGGNGHWYELVTTPLNWSAAKADAEGRGGQLAVVTTEGEEAFIASQGTAGNPWIGGYQDRDGFIFSEPLAGWTWIDGATWTDTNWQSGEPNDAGGAEHHLAINSSTGDFFDANGTAPRAYLVEYTADPRPTGGSASGHSLTITTEDLGHVGLGGNLVDTNTIPINVTEPAAFADAPTHPTLPATLDDTFNANGIQILSLTPSVDYVHDMQVLPSRKVLAIGAVNDNFAVMRFNADMTLDTTFGDGGGKRLDFGAGVHARSFAIDSTGRIIVVGGNRIARFTADGALDTTFSGDGWATDDYVVHCHGITIEADGNYLVTGRDNEHFRLSRWSPEGARSATYNRDVNIANYNEHHEPHQNRDYARSVISKDDGDILILGTGGDYTG
jgi:uncharacterized delta-60 repeat protein